jgi:hypothetical protein
MCLKVTYIKFQVMKSYCILFAWIIVHRGFVRRNQVEKFSQCCYSPKIMMPFHRSLGFAQDRSNLCWNTDGLPRSDELLQAVVHTVPNQVRCILGMVSAVMEEAIC